MEFYSTLSPESIVLRYLLRQLLICIVSVPFYVPHFTCVCHMSGLCKVVFVANFSEQFQGGKS